MTTKRPTLEIGLVGGIHVTAPVSKDPQVTLSSWRAYRLSDGDLHLSGWHDEGHEGRVSSSVTSIDAVSAIAITATGRRYVLAGPPGRNMDAAYVWQGWLRLNAFEPSDATDVTAELWADIQQAQNRAAQSDAEQAQAVHRQPP